MKHPLYVAFVWHMHQPYYLDAESGDLILPWVRLHAAKDYLHMVDILDDYPSVHATFNMVPSLVEQLQGYISGELFDRAWRVSLKERLSDDDKAYIDGLFYSISTDRFIKSYPRYWQLLQMRQEARGDLGLLGDTYWQDLIAWFNLAWIDPSWLQRDPVLRALVAKGARFTRGDIAAILGKQKELMAVTLTAYRRLARRGQVELTTSPYYHPILPLLIDTDSAREPSPWLNLPDIRFQRREDAVAQLRRGVASHEAVFGRTPAGLWPSEGAVSQELVEVLAEVPEIRWMASDEVILARSMGRGIERNGWGYLTDPRFLYQPYWVRSGEHRVAMVFRDHYLSDRIGFIYKDMSGRQAAEDLMFRLACIHESVKDDPHPYLVSIILDGENCWEHYEQNGETFLRSLYEMLSNQDRISAVTVGEFLNRFPPRAEISRLATGSWINGNLETWIGEDTQNRGWEYLHRTREAMERALEGDRVPPEARERARLAMMAAEGSDWFWWYYSHNVSDQDELFDRLFRHHLVAVFRALDLPVPDWADIPIITAAPKLASRAPSGLMRISLDQADLSPAPWEPAGYVEPVASTGSMQQGSALLKRMYFGRDETQLFLRLESHARLSGYTLRVYVSRLSAYPEPDGQSGRGARVEDTGARPSFEISIGVDGQSIEFSRWHEQGGWTKIESVGDFVAADCVVLLAVPLECLGVTATDALGLSAVLFAEGHPAQRLPDKGEAILDLRRAGSDEHEMAGRK